MDKLLEDGLWWNEKNIIWITLRNVVYARKCYLFIKIYIILCQVFFQIKLKAFQKMSISWWNMRLVAVACILPRFDNHNYIPAERSSYRNTRKTFENYSPKIKQGRAVDFVRHGSNICCNYVHELFRYSWRGRQMLRFIDLDLSGQKYIAHLDAINALHKDLHKQKFFQKFYMIFFRKIIVNLSELQYMVLLKPQR